MDRADSLIEQDGLPRSSGDRTVSPYHPPAIAPDRLALANRLCLRRTPVAITLGDVAVTMTPIGLGSLNALAPPAARIQMWFTIDGQPLILQMARGLFERILSRVDPELLAADIDQGILPLLLESCIEDSLADAEAALGSRIELSAVQPGSAFDLDGLDVALEISIDGQKAGIAALSAALDDIEQLATLFAGRPKPARRYRDLKVEFSLRPRAIWLDLGELQSLKPGDVLIAEENARHWHDISAIAGEHYLFQLEMTPKGPTVRAPFRRADRRDQEEWMMVETSQTDDDEDALLGLFKGRPNRPADRSEDKADEKPNEAAAQDAVQDGDSQADDDQSIDIAATTPPADAAFDDLPIKLVFEFGRLELPLGELQEIGPGHVFELNRPIGEAVDIHAGGRRIGQGEVVRIDDQIGVRVVRLFGQSEA